MTDRLTVGDDSTPVFATVRNCTGAGKITSSDRAQSEAYRKFLSQGPKR